MVRLGGILLKLVELIKQFVKDNKEELKEILWTFLLALVKMVRENKRKTI